MLCFIKAPLKPKTVLNDFELESLLQRRVRRTVPTEIEFFHRYQPENQVDFEAEFHDGFKLVFKAICQDRGINYLLYHPNREEPVVVFSTALKGASNTWVMGGGGAVADPLLYVLSRFEQLKRELPSIRPDNVKLDFWELAHDQRTEKNLRFISNIVMIDADFVRNIEKVEDAFWAEILKRRSDKPLIKILNQTYSLPIEGFSFANYRDGRSKIFAMLPEISKHIDDYGDGFRYAFSILTIASQMKDTALLLEEPEVHQHEGALKPLFEALLKFATNNKLQVFISTHSLDVIKTLTQLYEDVKVYHVSLTEEDELKVRSISGTDAKLMIDLGVSPLKLDYHFSYLVLEGKEDRVFLEAIARKLKQCSLKDLGYEVLQSPKNEQHITVAALVSTGKPIISCMDFDKSENLPDLAKPFLGSLKNKYGEIAVEDNIVKIMKNDSTIKLIPMGLLNDKELGEAGISQHCMEDVVLKLLCVDEGVRKWVGVDLKELGNKAKSLGDVPHLHLSSSKTLIMALGVLKEKTPEMLIPEIIDKADSGLLKETLKPFIAQLFC